MSAFKFGKRATFKFVALLGAVLLLATPAMALIRGGLSGQWQDWGDGVWDYYYWSPTNCEYWRFKSNHETRFAYKRTPGQWWQYTSSHGGYFAIGHGGVNNDFLGDDTYDHVVDSEWTFRYYWNQDCAYWMDTSDNEWRFAYKYGPGQWWDYTNQWGHLGLGALATAAFIGDENWHIFDTSNMAGGNYLGYTADAYFRYYGGAYYWWSGGTSQYKFVYGAGYAGSWYWNNDGTWNSMTYNGTWQNPDTRYHGGGIFIENGLVYDPGTNGPSGARNLKYNVWSLGGGNWDFVTQWQINRPGSDNRWSGGNLNVVWCHNDFHRAYQEYTIDDAVVFVQNMETIGFGTMVNWLTLVRDYFRKQVSNVAFKAHGNSTGWYIGSWISTSNYSSYYSTFVRWGGLMTSNGQIISYHCSVGQATTMLNNIASWTGCDVFANNHTVWTYWNWITSPNEENSAIWNYNYRNVRWRVEGGGLDNYFEYTSTGSQNWHQLFVERTL